MQLPGPIDRPRRIRAVLAAVLAVLAVLAAVAVAAAPAAPAAPALAVPGDLDQSFGVGGQQTVDYGGTDRATHVAVTPDGRIVVIGSTDATGGGDWAVTRLQSGGTPDPSFSGDGRLTIGTGPGVNDIGAGVVVLPDERIIVSGQGNASQDFVTERLGADGTVDPTFAGGSGRSSVDFGANETENAMIAQPDGKYLLVGSTSSSGGGDFAIVRLNTDGTLDTSFSGDGRQTVDFGGGADSAISAAVQPDGKIVVVGQGAPVNGPDMVAARLNPDGSLDPSFGSGGRVSVDFGGNNAANGVTIQPDGHIVLVGSSSGQGGGDVAIARLNPDGGLDHTFSGDGLLTFGFGAADEAALAVALQQNGKLVVMANGDADHDFMVSRVLSDGSLDAGFGDQGTVAVDFGGFEFDGDVALQPDGQIVIAGSTNVSDGGDIALARLNGDPVPTTTTTTTTPSTSTPTSTTPQPPLPPAPTAGLTTRPSPDGQGIVLDGSGTTGATVLHWDINGDGKPDISSDPSLPFLKLILPTASAPKISLTAVGAAGATSTATVQPRLIGTGLPASKVPQVGIAASHINVFSATPLAACTTADISIGLVGAHGCFTHITNPDQVPDRERASADNYWASNSQANFYNIVCVHAAHPLPSCPDLKRKLDAAYSTWVSRSAIRLNGMTLTPSAGASVVVDPIDARVFSSDARLTLGPFVIKTGAVDLDFADLVKRTGNSTPPSDLTYTGVSRTLATFDARKDVPVIGGFPLDAGAELQFASTNGVRSSRTTLHVMLPQIFDAFGSGTQPSASASVDATNDRGFFLNTLDLRVPHASIGGIGLDNVAFHFADGGDMTPGVDCPRKYWHATADIHLGNGPDGAPGAGLSLVPPPVQNGIAFCDGGFKAAGATLSFGAPIPPPQLFPGVFLDNINFEIGLHPTLLRGGATISAAELTRIHGDLLAVFATPWEPYTLTSADAGPGLQDLAGRRFTSTSFAVGGDIGLHVPGVGDLDIAHGGAVYSYPDYVGLGAKVNAQLGIFSFDGSLGAQFAISRGLFEADASAHICVFGFSFACGGGLLVVSEKGAVACVELGPLNPGIGVMTNGHLDVWIPDGCKPSHYWSAGRSVFAHSRSAAATGAPITVTVARGETAKSIKLVGAGGAPRVVIRAPGGQTLTVAGDGGFRNGALQGLSSSTYATTWLGIKDGAPGPYTITPLPGSAQVSDVQMTRPGYDTNFTAKVTGHGGRLTLHYDARRRGGGQKVTFYEDGASVMHPLVSSDGGRGTVRFTPAPGAAGTRTIVARATVDGSPIKSQTLARFHYAGTVRTGRPGRVVARRRGGALAITWARAAGAMRYGVLVNRTDGSQRRYELAAGRRSLRIRNFPTTVGARVTVSARGTLGDWGPAGRSAVVKAAHRAPSIVLTRKVHRRGKVHHRAAHARTLG